MRLSAEIAFPIAAVSSFIAIAFVELIFTDRCRHARTE